jgi:DnaK suppressor protein
MNSKETAMSHDLNAKQYALLEALLKQKQQALEQDLQAQLGDQGRAEHAREQLLQDGDDERARDADREVDLARSDQALEALRLVNAALLRLRAPDGEYGKCLECSEPISFARLQSSPEVTRCLVCQSAREKAAGGAAPRYI